MELYNLTAHEVAKKLRDKEISVKDVVNSTFDRIEEKEPEIQAYLYVNKEEALKKADEVQKGFDKNEEMPDLAGIPIGIKDNICTKGVKTTCGSRMLENFVPPYNATVIEKLEDSKAIITGKLNMDEFAMGSSTETSYFQKTKNPHNLECVPGGSSGGSAAAVASGEAFLALGSDTGGSVRQPASFCGVVGLKPTYGRVSRNGLVAYASSFDQIGTLTKDVTDCAILMNVISGHDHRDTTSLNVELPNYKDSLVKGIEGLKIGIPKGFFGEGTNIEVKQSIFEGVKILEKAGAKVEEFEMPIVEYALPIYYVLAWAEASSNLARFDGIRYGHRAEKFENLHDLYCQSRSEGFGDEVKRRIMLGTYVLSSGYYDAYYNQALKARTVVKNTFDEAFRKYDVLVTPTSPVTAFKIGEKIDNPLEMYLADICTVPINIAGLPAINIPCGKDSAGLPIGMQMIGKAFAEPTLLKAAYNLEQLMK